MELSICINCGEKKPAPWKSCKACGHDPRIQEEDLVKSVYLSTGRFEDGNEKADYVSVLQALAQTLKEGKQVTYDQDDMDRLSRQRAAIEDVDSKTVWGAVFRFFLPALVLIAVLVLLLVVLKML